MNKIVITVASLLLTIIIFIAPAVEARVSSMRESENLNTQSQVEGGEHLVSIETVIQDILNQQNVSTIQELNFAIIRDLDWDRLGDAVMELQHPGKAHEVMDRMMGGEGSVPLRQMHISMGKAYLSYENVYDPGMMSYRHNNRSLKGGELAMMGYGSMMGFGFDSGMYLLLSTVTWIALIVFLIAGSFYFIKQARKK